MISWRIFLWILDKKNFQVRGDISWLNYIWNLKWDSYFFFLVFFKNKIKTIIKEILKLQVLLLLIVQQTL